MGNVTEIWVHNCGTEHFPQPDGWVGVGLKRHVLVSCPATYWQKRAYEDSCNAKDCGMTNALKEKDPEKRRKLIQVARLRQRWRRSQNKRPKTLRKQHD